MRFGRFASAGLVVLAATAPQLSACSSSSAPAGTPDTGSTLTTDDLLSPDQSCAFNDCNAACEPQGYACAAMGDWAAIPHDPACGSWDGKTVPARAQAAHQQASYLERVLIARLHQGRVTTPFVYRDFGSLVSLGDNKGVGNLMGGLAGRNFFVEGLIAKWMYMSLHLNHHRAILGTSGTAVLALARLLQRRVSGRLKLH